jgi:hypothetical protein
MNQSDELRRVKAALVTLIGVKFTEPEFQSAWETVCDAAARQAAESPGPDDLVCCARCNEMKECLWIETGFAGEHEPLCASCISAERSLAEVSADEIVEAVLIAVANIPINPALRGDLVYVKDVYAAIRALKGTFSLRASGTPDASEAAMRVKELDYILSRFNMDSDRDEIAEHREELAALAAAPTLRESGTPDYRNELLAIDSLIPRKAGDNRSVYSRMLELSGAKGPQSTVQAVAPTLSEAGALEKCGEPAASFIPRWGMSWACVLPKGHEGDHEGDHERGGNCFKHGEYVGANCPKWPDCVAAPEAGAKEGGGK